MPCIQKNPVNRNNFLRWHTATDLTLPLSNSPGYCGAGPGLCDFLADPDALETTYFMPLVNGDRIEFFVNSSSPLQVGDFATLSIGLIGDLELKYDAIGGLSKIDAPTGGYWLYGWFNVDCFKDGVYNPVIKRGNQVILIANPVRVCNREDWQRNTVLARYRGEYNIFGYQYGELPTFYNQFRLDAWLYDIQFPEERETYKDLNNRVRTTSLRLSKTYSLQTFYLDEETHLAARAMLTASTLQVNGVNYQPDGTYEPQPSENGFNLFPARVRLQDMDYAKNIKLCY